LTNNIFYNNGAGHYFDSPRDRTYNSQSELNSIPLVNASNNLVADPLFEEGEFRWRGGVYFTGEHRFFLQQTGTIISPAVDAGFGTVEDQRGCQRLTERSTRTDFVADVGIADIGFHYKKNNN